MKKRTEKLLAKGIYNTVAMMYYVIAGLVIAAIATLGTHALFPDMGFYTFLVVVMVEMYIGLFIIAGGAYVGKRVIYKILCKITRSK